MTKTMEIFEHVWGRCKAHFLQHKGKFTANITLCGYDHYQLGETELGAKINLCNELSNNKWIQEEFNRYTNEDRGNKK